MKNFEYSYDKENDDLFIYQKELKSSGAIELGNLIIDLDEKGNLVAIQIINASEFFSKFISKIIEITDIKTIEAELIQYRNIEGLKLDTSTKKQRNPLQY